jgi:hypothetical protein
LPIAFRRDGDRLLFRHKVIGIAAPSEDGSQLEKLYEFLKTNRAFVAFFAAFGAQYLIGRQAALLKKNIMDLPYPEGGQLVFRGVQKYLRDDVIDFMIPLVKDTQETHLKLAALVSVSACRLSLMRRRLFLPFLTKTPTFIKGVERMICLSFHF